MGFGDGAKARLGWQNQCGESGAASGLDDRIQVQSVHAGAYHITTRSGAYYVDDVAASTYVLSPLTSSFVAAMISSAAAPCSRSRLIDRSGPPSYRRTLRSSPT